jgi:hypothetical protein
MVDGADPIRDVTQAGAVATVAFVLASWLTTQVETLGAAMPFTEDPYDAVVSYALIGIGVVGGVTVLRATSQFHRPYQASVARRIAIGAVITSAIGALALGSDVAAIVVVGVDTGQPGVALGLGLVAVAVVVTAVALGIAWRARHRLADVADVAEAEPDLLDALGSIAGAIGARTAASTFIRWSERSPLSPRRHRILIGLLGAVIAALGAVAWHALREGPWASPAAAAIFGTLMAIGVGGAYLLCLEPLRILRPAGRG